MRRFESVLKRLGIANGFALLLALVCLVGDGWTGRPSPLAHQVLLLPLTSAFLVVLARSLWPVHADDRTPRRALLSLLLCFEILSALLFVYAAHHFATFGYQLFPLLTVAIFAGSFVIVVWTFVQRQSTLLLFLSACVAFTAGRLLQIFSFPLNYLRSDMLPVILWADTNLLHGVSPYRTIHIADRLYDFPYLPGMLVAFLPFVAAGLDLRVGALIYLLAAVGLIFLAARPERRAEAGLLTSLFLLNPFLQYRHEIYLQPHWFTLAAAFVLMQRRSYRAAAAALGASMAVYQFSWILFPFFLLNSLRRRGWPEVGRGVLFGSAGALAVAGPFLPSAVHRISTNTVEQWSKLPHAVADPMNLSYWATYLVAPNHLLRLQAALMVGIFGYCFFAGRCRTMTDTLRWMVVALTTFVLFNVIVDGYFYLMILFLMLIYTCVANGWWAEPEITQRSDELSPVEHVGAVGGA